MITLFDKSEDKLNIPQPKERDIRKILGFIEDNNIMSNKLAGDRMIYALLKEEKKLKGDCKLGVVVCIDGRISILHQFGRTVNTWEIAGSLVEAEKRSDQKVYLTSQRLIGTLIDAADFLGDRNLLEIVTAHTSSDPEHKCGKMTGVAKANNLKTDRIDKIAMDAAELRRQAIENKYNEILIDRNRNPQVQVAITAMIDTDTMGFILNYGKDNPLSTTQIIKDGLADKIKKELSNVGEFGSMKQGFVEIKSYQTYLERTLMITNYLMKTETKGSYSQINSIKKYISVNYPKLTPDQQQALLFTICRTIANQYVTGLAGEEIFDHPYSQHTEDYIVVSPFGKPFGRFDLSRQSFGSTPNDRQDALEHVRTKLSIMDTHTKHNKHRAPKIIFISTPVKKEILGIVKGSPTFAEIVDSNRRYYQFLLEDQEIKTQILEGRIILVPILVDDDTGVVLEIMEDNPLFVNQGSSLSDMPEQIS